jgi:hypothetical protein
MLQEPTTSWDLRYVPVETSSTERLYMLLLFIVFIVGIVELVRTWRIVPSPKISLSTESATLVKRLQTAATRLKQWIYLTFLTCGFLTSYELSRESKRLLSERIHDGPAELVYLRGFFALLGMTFIVAIFVFLVQWRIIRRIARFSDQIAP